MFHDTSFKNQEKTCLLMIIFLPPSIQNSWTGKIDPRARDSQFLCHDFSVTATVCLKAIANSNWSRIIPSQLAAVVHASRTLVLKLNPQEVKVTCLKKSIIINILAGLLYGINSLYCEITCNERFKPVLHCSSRVLQTYIITSFMGASLKHRRLSAERFPLLFIICAMLINMAIV